LGSTLHVREEEDNMSVTDINDAANVVYNDYLQSVNDKLVGSIDCIHTHRTRIADTNELASQDHTYTHIGWSCRWSMDAIA